MANAPAAHLKVPQQNLPMLEKRALVIVESPAKAKTMNKYLGLITS